MSQVIRFPLGHVGDVQTSPIASAVGVVATTPTQRAFNREAYRARVAETAQAFLDIAHYCFAELDKLDGDADYEPNEADEDDGTLEPPAAALVALTGIRWHGYDTGGAA